MNYVEIIGPSGAGKTTFRKSLTGIIPSTVSTNTDMISCFMSKYKVPLVRHWPTKIQSTLLKRHIIPEYRSRFCDQYPEAELSAQKVIELSPGEKTEQYLNREMARYQLFQTCANKKETMVIDDGIYQFNLILVEKNFDVSDIVDVYPNPDILIYIDTPPRTCLARQEQRPRGRASAFAGLNTETALRRLESMRKSSEKMCNELKSRETVVFKINSEKSQTEVIRDIARSLEGQ